MNIGERDELLIKLTLVRMRDRGIKLNGVPITSIGFGSTEYLCIPCDTPENMESLNDDALSCLASRTGISKAGVFAKSDVYVNGIGYSLKSFSGAPPALVNHTARPGFERACRHSGIDIKELDKLIDKYWDLRLRGIIKEDVRNSDPNCPFRNSKLVLKPILEYFLFIGSGRGPSDYSAEYVLDYSEPQDSDTWNILNPDEAVDLVWDNLIFSIRSKKGMPADYDIETYDGPNAESIARWTKEHCGDFRGALHIRVHK